MDVYQLAILFSVAFILVVLDLVRRRRLKEKYSLLWIFVGLLMLVLSTFRSAIEHMAAFFHVYYAPSLLFLVGLVFCFSLILHVTVVLSRLEDRVVRLAQEAAILREEIEQKAIAERGNKG
ncbi:MAG: DUF2304 domain-containing protein [Kyrpidia tusciae]|nr:DUF2304 domain-containing protein [Kyrpidia tusciae]MBE3552654.1 DUF2304 domain-containing protein [Kyrpidia tusciae]